MKAEVSKLRADIVHAVASIPDSLEIWFYGKKRNEEGRALGCGVRAGDFASKMVALSGGGHGTNGEMESSQPENLAD